MGSPLRITLILLILCILAGSFGGPAWKGGEGFNGYRDTDLNPMGIPISPGAISLQINQSIAQTRQGLDEFSAIPDTLRTTENTLIRFEHLMNAFDDHTRVLTFLSYEYPDPIIAAEAEEARFFRDSFLNDLYLDPAIADTISKVHPDTVLDQRLQSRILEMFQYAHLSPSEKRNLTLLGEDLSHLESAYLQNQRTNQASANLMLMPQILSLRQQIVSILGYSSFASYQIATSGIPVQQSELEAFLLNRSMVLRHASHTEAVDLLREKQKNDPIATQVFDYEIAPLHARLKNQSVQEPRQLIASYFPIESVLPRIHNTLSDILGIRILEVPGPCTKIPDIHLYRMINSSSSDTLAWFYLWLLTDPDSGSTSGRSYLLRAGRWENGSWISPVSFLIIPLQSDNQMGKKNFSLDELQILFHEYGHLMRQSLVTSPYRTLSVSDPSGFTEVPSLFFERLLFTPEMLDRLAGFDSGYSPKTADPNWIRLRDHSLNARGEEESYGSGYIRVYQVLLASMDLALHGTNTSISRSFLPVWNDQYQNFTGYASSGSGSSLLLNPSFFLGNEGTYWHYILDDAYAGYLFERFQKEGILNRSTGIAFKKDLLEPAGTQDPIVLMHAFREMEPGSLLGI